MEATPIVTLADDQSPGADLAWMWIVNHDWDDWPIRVLHARREGGGPGGAPTSAPHPWQTQRRRTFPAGNPLREPEHVEIDGDPRAVLSSLEAPGILVVGARGQGLLKAMRIGSTAEWLLARPPVPLVIARHGRPTRRLLACVDGSRDSRTAVEAALALPWIQGVEVIVLGVQERGFHPQDAVELTVADFQAAGARAEGIAYGPNDPKSYLSVRDIVLDVARERDVDIMALGSRGIGGWDAYRVGSVASALARHAPCSVLIAHDGRGVGRLGDQPGEESGSRP